MLRVDLYSPLTWAKVKPPSNEDTHSAQTAAAANHKAPGGQKHALSF